MPYPTEIEARDAIVLLLATAWPMLPMAVRRARMWGADWFGVSTPFVQRENGDKGDPIAHVGVMELPLRVAGKNATVAGIHAVCTHPAHRKKGKMRAAMNEALAFVDGRWPTAALWTPEPAIYEPFGFRVVKEHVFRAPLDPPFEARAATTLALGSRDDVARLAELLDRRTPVSDAFATREKGVHALIDLSLWPAPAPKVDYVDGLDCAVVYEVDGLTLRVFDVIGDDIPSIHEIAARIGVGVTQVELYVSPDALDVPNAVPAPHPMQDVLMVRGPLFDGAPPFALSPLTRC